MENTENTQPGADDHQKRITRRERPSIKLHANLTVPSPDNDLEDTIEELKALSGLGYSDYELILAYCFQCSRLKHMFLNFDKASSLITCIF